MDPVSAEVWENKEIATGIFRLKLRPYGPVPRVAPGRFFMIGLGPGLDPLLRRPLGHLCTSLTDNGIHLLEFLYEVRGRGTGILARIQPPAVINFIGPLGEGWRLDGEYRRIVMVAGGMGVVPLYAAARALQLTKPKPWIDFLFGARTARGLVLGPEIKAIVDRFHSCAEDGSCEHAGLVTAPLQEMLSKPGPSRGSALPGAILRGPGKKDRARKGALTKGALAAATSSLETPLLVLACGPRPMLTAVAKMTRAAGVACQVSLEARMACGMGACLTCSVRGADGKNVRVCREGPVFDAAAIDWEALDESA